MDQPVFFNYFLYSIRLHVPDETSNPESDFIYSTLLSILEDKLSIKFKRFLINGGF